MKATGIIRRIDDLDRLAIPKEIRRSMNINAEDALEIYLTQDAICLKKYKTTEEDFSQKCMMWVQEHKDNILSVNFVDNTTYVIFIYNAKVKNVFVKFNPKDKFDMNVAICYAAKKCGFQMFDGFSD